MRLPAYSPDLSPRRRAQRRRGERAKPFHGRASTARGVAGTAGRYRGRAGGGRLRARARSVGAEGGGGAAMSSLRERRERAARAVSELAVEVRREDESAPARAASSERWRRKQDEPARIHHANGILALRCYIKACGYDFDLAGTQKRDWSHSCPTARRGAR
ncbi:MAG: hypothetical protein DMF66_16115 [Acidobacteria bacterium]|nr:MAG: hypothetical protein DMF66_16115 [Acidobacteriota bacterium]